MISQATLCALTGLNLREFSSIKLERPEDLVEEFRSSPLSTYCKLAFVSSAAWQHFALASNGVERLYNAILLESDVAITECFDIPESVIYETSALARLFLFESRAINDVIRAANNLCLHAETSGGSAPDNGLITAIKEYAEIRDSRLGLGDAIFASKK